MQLDEDLVNAFSKIKKFQARHRSALSKLDKKISDYYHAIDVLDLPAHKLAQVVKELKATLRERRNLKHTTAFVNSLTRDQSMSVQGALKNADLRAKGIKEKALQTYNEMFTATGEIK